MLDFGIKPESAVSSPVLLQDDRSAFLTFNAERLRADGMFEEAGTAIVEIIGCSSTKFGYPNNEAIAGHPLYAKGLEAYDIFQVLNSSWDAEHAAQNLISFPNPRLSQSRPKHFIFTFHDSTFECLADEIKIEVSNEPYAQIFRRISERFLKGSY